MAVFGGNSQTDQYAFVQYQNALSLPLSSRCQIIGSLLQTVSFKELKFLFGRLVEDVFGFQGKQDWGLLTLDPRDKDYNALKSFLAVDGPVLQLSYKLLEDPQAEFEFHVSCLPAPARQCLEKGTIPTLYMNKAQSLPGGAVSAFIRFNSFEFFLFHFTYFIVNPTWKGYTSSVNQVNTLYAYLLEEYLRHFLPIDGNSAPVLSPIAAPPSPNKTFFGVSYLRNTSSQIMANLRGTDQTFLNTTNSPLSNYGVQHRHRTSLLKPRALEMVDSIPDYHIKGVAPLGASKSETWRSEEFISILSEMYLNQACQKQIQNIAGILKERYVPSHYHVYMVRVFVKHVHYFANSFVGNASPFVVDLLGELKSIVLPALIQKNLHSFLKLVFDRWPLDDSFRVPLEAWLSYIQPWRYIDSRAYKDAMEKGFMKQWQKFVSENLHFYVPFFFQVLHRFSRMDLSCPKTAYMLFRATKVFSQNDLDALILEAEKHHTAGQSKSPAFRSPYAEVTENTTYFSETSMLGFQNSQNSSLPGGCLSLYNKNLVNLVSRLIAEIMSTRDKASAMKEVNGSDYKGFFASFFSASEDSHSISAEEYSPSDSKKLIFFLETSVNNLCSLFKLTPPSYSTMSKSNNNFGIPENLSTQTFGDFGDKQQLSPLKKLNMFGGKTKDIDYHGNPDLQPVRTYEYEILVKMFSDVSAFLNNKYAQKIEELYFRPSVLGRICQQMLVDPTDYYKIIKSKDMQSVNMEKVHLPPRICLRILANKHIVWYLVIYFLFMYLMSYHPLSAILILIFLIVLFVSVRALFIQSKTHVKRD